MDLNRYFIKICSFHFTNIDLRRFFILLLINQRCGADIKINTVLK